MNQFDVPIEKTVKTLVVEATQESGSNFVALLVRGDHTLNEFKAAKLEQVANPLRFAAEEEIREAIGAGPGSLGPVKLDIPCIADSSVVVMSDFTAGANTEDKHYFGINWVRDVCRCQKWLTCAMWSKVIPVLMARVNFALPGVSRSGIFSSSEPSIQKP